MYSKFTKDLIKEISKNTNISEVEIRNIIMSVFELTKKTIESADKKALVFPSVRIPSFGIFYVTDGRKKYYKSLNSNKDA